MRLLQELASAARVYQNLSNELELKRHSLILLEERIAGSESAQLAATVEELETQLQQANAAAEAAREKKAGMVEEAKRLEKEIANFGKEIEKRIKVRTPSPSTTASFIYFAILLR
jgi:structural maintenance of chromosome 2